MRVFILEDDPIRVDYLRMRLGQHDLTVVSSCTEADRFKPPYDLILLDHDLGGRQMEEHEDDGLAFVNLIRDRINKDAVIILHSYNPGGAARQHNALRQVGKFGGLHSHVAPFRSGAFNRILLTVVEARCTNKETLENLSQRS